ncbi:STAS domain-containing protein [Streptomyces ficellus]|uniref:STAS domain-containing protein n=1 Tax=Streptomyces ficellus TaxID=1977088 RepID=A0ABT7Z8J4_9ACTN|nr:STAS domain-containing protein [Streptomyces ficellus]MDN3295814.1 STAS domain-containing protein [Streptomyces ficellus]
MQFPFHRLTAGQLVIEINDVIDFDQEDAVQRDLRAVISRSGARTVIIDVRTPLVTAAAVNVLVRLRRSADRRGAVLCVVARRPLARKVFRIAGVYRFLLVTATLSGAVAIARGCRPASGPPLRRGDGALT